MEEAPTTPKGLADTVEPASDLKRLLAGGRNEREQACATLAAAAAGNSSSQADDGENEELIRMLVIVVPSVASVLARDISVVEPAEFRRAAYLLLDLVMIDNRILGEWIRVSPTVISAINTAPVACLDKPAQQLVSAAAAACLLCTCYRSVCMLD